MVLIGAHHPARETPGCRAARTMVEQIWRPGEFELVAG